jgi:hypothetical protein
MATEGGLFPRGRGGAGLAMLRVQYFVDCVWYYFTHDWPIEKVAGGIVSSLEVIILWRPGRRQSLRDFSAGCAMSVWLIWLIRPFPHMHLCIPSYSNLSTCLGCCLRLVHYKLHFIFPILTATNPPPSPPSQNLKRIKARHLGPFIAWKENKTMDPIPLYFLSCKCFNTAILLALCTSSIPPPPYTILAKQFQYELYNFQNCWNWQTNFIQRKTIMKKK